MDEGRRFFLKSLTGASVAYCFLSSLPVIGGGTSEIVHHNTLITPEWVLQHVLHTHGWADGAVQRIKRGPTIVMRGPLPMISRDKR